MRIRMARHHPVALTPTRTIHAAPGQEFDASALSPGAAQGLVAAGIAEEVKPENKAFTAYETPKLPEFKNKNEAIAWAAKRGIDVDRRKGLENILSDLEAALVEQPGA